jgi:neutral ceramidase
MGYAMINQKGAGLHLRSRARAFVFVDPASGSRLAFVNLDIW